MNILGQSIIGTAKKILYAGALLTLLNQDLSAQTKTPSQDKFFKTLDFQPFEREAEHQTIIDKIAYNYIINKINLVDNYDDLFQLINNDPEVNIAFTKYLKDINHKNASAGNDTMSGFLFSLGVAIDHKYNHLTIIGVSNIDYSEIIRQFPLLSSLTITNQSPVKIFLVEGETDMEGMGGIDGNIVIVDNHNNKDRTLLNEFTAEIFSRYAKDIKLLYPEFTDTSGNLSLPNKLGDLVLDKVLGPTIIEDQRNEYRGDLCNLSFDPSTHLEHILQYAITEDGILHSYGYSNKPEVGKYKAAGYINQQNITYLTSKHQIGKYLLGKEVLSIIKFQKSNLRNHYQTLIKKESKTQYTEKKISEKEYMSIAEKITLYIQKDPQALQKIQQRAIQEKEKLEKYFQSLTQSK